MTLIIFCDECGQPAVVTIHTATGRVLFDGVDNNRQGCALCAEHAPRDGSLQPHNCKRVSFRWPENPD